MTKCDECGSRTTGMWRACRACVAKREQDIQNLSEHVDDLLDKLTELEDLCRSTPRHHGVPDCQCVACRGWRLLDAWDREEESDGC